MKNRIIEEKNVYVLVTHKNFYKLPSYVQDDILFASANFSLGSKKSIKKILYKVLKEQKFYVKYKNGEVFRIFTEEQMKHDLQQERTQTRKVLFEKFMPAKLRPRRRVIAIR